MERKGGDKRGGFRPAWSPGARGSRGGLGAWGRRRVAPAPHQPAQADKGAAAPAALPTAAPERPADQGAAPAAGCRLPALRSPRARSRAHSPAGRRDRCPPDFLQGSRSPFSLFATKNQITINVSVALCISAADQAADGAPGAAAGPARDSPRGAGGGGGGLGCALGPLGALGRPGRAEGGRSVRGRRRRSHHGAGPAVRPPGVARRLRPRRPRPAPRALRTGPERGAAAAPRVERVSARQRDKDNPGGGGGGGERGGERGGEGGGGGAGGGETGHQKYILRREKTAPPFLLRQEKPAETHSHPYPAGEGAGRGARAA